MILNTIVYAAIVPLAVAVCVAFACRQMRCAATIAWAAGVTIGFIAGQFALASENGAIAALTAFVAPREAVHWLPHAMLLVLGIHFLSTYDPRAAQPLCRLTAIVLVVAWPLRLLAGSASVTVRWTLVEKLVHLAVLAATFGLAWLVLAAPGDADQPRLRPFLLIVVAVGSAVVVALSGVFVYGELCGVLAAAIGGVFLTANFLSSRLNGASGLAGPVACSFVGLIILGSYYGGLSTANAALALLALVAAGGPTPSLVASRPPWQQTALRVAACLTPLAFAIASSLAAANTAAASPYGV